MNYRHVFHAGNHTEILKHTVLVHLLETLCRKEKPFFALDTHAGMGIYDLTAEEATRTGEAEEGIRRVAARGLPAAQRYLDLVRSMNPTGQILRYPGSPAIIKAFLREGDRLVACELHPEDAKVLRLNFRTERRVAVHHRSGYEAVKAFLPPPEGRGLVLIDPSFEHRDEFSSLSRALVAASRRWPAGNLAAWYPIKYRDLVSRFHDTLQGAGVRECLCAELTVRPQDGTTLAGGGMVLINPPWRTDEALEELGPQILDALQASQGRSVVRWLTPSI